MGPFTDSAVLTISPIDPNIRVIHCVTVQTGFEDKSDVLPISVFGDNSNIDIDSSMQSYIRLDEHFSG